jgi:hypothetical protein
MRLTILAALILLIILPALGLATGNTPTAPSANQSLEGSATSSGSIKAYGAGSTGLTSTAPCLGSHAILFNLASSTYVEQGCLLRIYAAQHCNNDACRKAAMCLDPDLLDEAKTLFGCPPKAKR